MIQFRPLRPALFPQGQESSAAETPRRLLEHRDGVDEQLVAHPRSRAGDRHREADGRAGDGDGDAADADLLLALVHGVAAVAHAAELGEQLVGVGHGVRGVARQAGAGQQGPHVVVAARSASSALPTAVQCGRTRRPTSVNIRIECRPGHLGDVRHLVAVQHRQVGGLADLVDQVRQVGQRDGVEHRRGALGEQEQAGAERVAARGFLAQVAEVDERAGQPVQGRRAPGRRPTPAPRATSRCGAPRPARAARRPVRATARRPNATCHGVGGVPRPHRVRRSSGASPVPPIPHRRNELEPSAS